MGDRCWVALVLDGRQWNDKNFRPKGFRASVEICRHFNMIPFNIIPLSPFQHVVAIVAISTPHQTINIGLSALPATSGVAVTQLPAMHSQSRIAANAGEHGIHAARTGFRYLPRLLCRTSTISRHGFKTLGFPSQFIKSTKVLMATPQGRRLGYHTPK